MEFKYNEDYELYISKDERVLLWMDFEQLSFLISENTAASAYHFVDDQGAAFKDLFLDTDLQCVVQCSKNNQPRNMTVRVASRAVLSNLGHAFLSERDTLLSGFVELCRSAGKSRVIVNRHPELTIKVSRDGKQERIQRFVLDQFRLQKRI